MNVRPPSLISPSLVATVSTTPRTSAAGVFQDTGTGAAAVVAPEAGGETNPAMSTTTPAAETPPISRRAMAGRTLPNMHTACDVNVNRLANL
ncbi:hypothetical protein JCM9533A_75260 [Catenuloplanes niger JCM 9533]